MSSAIKKKAVESGFDACGIASAGKLDKEEAFLKTWLDNGLNASMKFMENHFEKRVNPQELVPGAKSIISVVHNYYPEKQQQSGVPKIARYAYGKDYHYVIKDKLKALLKYINDDLQPCSGRVFADSAPVLERAWAAKSGIGWIGKNTNLIVPNKGSYFFIGEIILDIELEYDSAIEDRCGSCTKCLQACPTNALVTPYRLDSNRCISFQTIENRAEIPEKFKGVFQDWVFGCDICQEVCPWNNFSKPTAESAYKPKEEFMNLSFDDWLNIDIEGYKRLFSGTAVERTKYPGLKRNLKFIKDSGQLK